MYAARASAVVHLAAPAVMSTIMRAAVFSKGPRKLPLQVKVFGVLNWCLLIHYGAGGDRYFRRARTRLLISDPRKPLSSTRFLYLQQRLQYGECASEHTTHPSEPLHHFG